MGTLILTSLLEDLGMVPHEHRRSELCATAGKCPHLASETGFVLFARARSTTFCFKMGSFPGLLKRYMLPKIKGHHLQVAMLR